MRVIGYKMVLHIVASAIWMGCPGRLLAWSYNNNSRHTRTRITWISKKSSQKGQKHLHFHCAWFYTVIKVRHINWYKLNIESKWAQDMNRYGWIIAIIIVSSWWIVHGFDLKKAQQMDLKIGSSCIIYCCKTEQNTRTNGIRISFKCGVIVMYDLNR